MKLNKTLSVILASLLLGSSAALTVSALEPNGTGILCRNWLTNDPNYSFSEAYKESVWYENFSALELGGNQRNNVLSVAISQLGYHEGDVGDYSGKGTSGGNCTEYARLLIPHYSDNAYEWCACFVNWCLNQAHIDYASSEIGCWKWVGELKTMKMFEDSAAYGGKYTPKPADMIFFNWKNTNTNSGHIGYVLYTTDTHVYTIEGNADNNVTVRSYALNDPCVIGYGTPPYEEGDVPTVDHSYKNGMPRGEYVVNGTVSLFKNPDGTGRITRIGLGSRVKLISAENGYAHVYYGEEKGYIPTDNIYLMAEFAGEDTLSYDANGGGGAPEAQSVPYGIAATVSDTLPTLEGDTFLGWSTVPYNYKVDFKAGDSISLEGNVTLYAVWEKRSLTLATEALAAGKAAEFERPENTANTGAIRLGTQEMLGYFDATDGQTRVKMASDDGGWGGSAIALISLDKSDDPYVIFDYASLCANLCYEPTSADTVDYIILRVMNVSLYNTALELSADCGSGFGASVSAVMDSSSDWQYLVLDMTDVEGFAGELQKLRIDWTKAADAEGNKMFFDSICFAANEAQRDAILAGKYIYPVQPTVLPPETEPETVTETAPETLPATEPETVPETEGVTEAETSAATTAETQPEKTGCGASLLGAGGVALLVSMGGALMLARKKND